MTKFISECHDGKKIERSIKIARQEIEGIVDSCIFGTGIVNYHDKVVTASACDFHRMLLEWSRKTSLDKAIRNILISTFYSTEAKMGGSGLVSAMEFLGELEVKQTQRKCTADDVLEVISSWNPQGVSSKISKEIFKMGACGSEVRLLEGDQYGTNISCLSGTSQSGGIESLFLANVGTEFKDTTPRYVIAIDGIIESIGQLHGIFEATEDEPLLIMAKGFLPDVANTLAANYPSRLNCIPFVVSDWFESDFLNLQKCGITCVSVESGDIIQNARPRNKINTYVSTQEVVFSGEGTSERLIDVSFGKDLGAMTGIAIDRVKLCLALSRFTSRTGIIKLRYKGVDFVAPGSSFQAAMACNESLSSVLYSIATIITYKKKTRPKRKRRKKKNVKKRSKVSLS